MFLVLCCKLAGGPEASFVVDWPGSEGSWETGFIFILFTAGRWAVDVFFFLEEGIVKMERNGGMDLP